MKEDLKNIYNIIEAFFKKSLTPSQEAELQELFEKNPDAQSVLDDEQSIREFMMEAELVAVREQMQKDLNSKSNKKATFYITAIVTLVSAIICYVVFSDSNKEYNSPKKESKPVIEKNEKQINEIKQVQPEKEISNEPQQQIQKTVVPVIENDDVEPSPIQESQNFNSENESVEMYVEDDILVIKTIEKQTEKDDFKPEKKTVEVCPKYTPIEIVVSENVTPENEYGSIQLKNTVANYTYAIGKEGEYSQITEFNDLQAGTYSIYCKDKNECITKIKDVTITETLCKSEYVKTFSPSVSQTWEIPVNTDLEYSVEIMSKQYKVLYKENSQSGNEAVWDGKNENGQLAPLGLYVATIKYATGETCIAKVNLIR